jgi:predicted alpha/beta-fold hydrolase
VLLSGLYGPVPGAETLAIVIHGHGGNAYKPYCHAAATAARAAGFSSLRLSLRGADLLGEDIYHGGLTNDLREFVARRQFSHYRKLLVFGFSMGGHIAIRAAVDQFDPRLQAVVAVSPPLDIPGAVRALDETKRVIYRRYIIEGIHRIYDSVARRRRGPVRASMARQAKTFRELDEMLVVPRFGFRSVDDYYESIDLSGRLGQMEVPVLVAGSNHDPVIPARLMQRALRGASRSVTSRWIDGGGHLHFPNCAGFGFAPGSHSMVSQCIGWARRYAGC